jgi:hypothetical protein
VLCVEPSWPSNPLVIKTPIIIGSIPFRENILENYNIEPLTSFSETDLPSYEECIFGSNSVIDENDQNEEINYLPVYPFYSNLQR